MSSRKPVQSDLYPSSRFEEEAFRTGARRIAGIDESGRGPLAGPVVAAAVIMPRGLAIPGLNDSKLVSTQERERIFLEIQTKAVAIGIGTAPPKIIEEINIYQATRLAMAQAITQITPPPDYLLIDGPISLALEIAQRSIVKGDRLCASVAAASIIAKVTRDRIMMKLHEQYPVYGFDAHKGYGTLAHREALKRYGPCPVHRMTFKGVKA
jgi:ribonuclease HII